MGNLDQKATNELVGFAIDQGINFIDTADVYSAGQSEEYVGNAIQGKLDSPAAHAGGFPDQSTTTLPVTVVVVGNIGDKLNHRWPLGGIREPL